MFSTGKLIPVPVGKSGFETKTRNFRPLARCVVVEGLLLPQEIMVTLAAISTKTLSKILFKPGTPKSMKDIDLDARKRIITERLRRISVAGPHVLAARMQKPQSSCILNAMATDLLTRMKQSAVLCDGAMGTLLYGKGIFINRCYDELNLSQPDLIRGIHHEYLQSGAEIIETNTFGGNSFRLARHSMASQVREINLAGARLAREAAKSFDVLVAGSVGPLGVQIEPLGKTSF
jgi:hypothetical protein